MSKQTVAVVFGGCSSEHEISRLSAACVIRNLPRDRYELLCLGITRQGSWYLTAADTQSIEDGSWESDPLNRQAFLSPDRSVHGIVASGPNGFEILRVDVVFPVLHGKNGEDGTIQGLLQLAGVPFVGCRTLSSACCMDKAVTHTLLTSAGIRQANYLWFFTCNYRKERDIQKIKTKIRARLGYPIFVKPANAGSSVGVSKVRSEEELDDAVERAAREDGKVVVEQFISGQEVECAVLGNEYPDTSTVGEIAASAEFYDYDDKYKNGTSRLYIPAHLSGEVMEKIRVTASRAYRMLGCRGLARVDFFVQNGTEVLLNEINTLPGFTAISMYPKLWEAAGVPVPELIDRLIQLAFV